MFQPERKELSNFFKADGEVFDIPPNQRAYAWKVQQAADLYSDLWSSVDPVEDEHTPRPRLFLGQIILSKGADEDTFEIVDGQQRLTTLSLLLACMRRRANTLNKPKIASKIHSEICVTEGDEDDTVRTRIKVSPSIAELYDGIVGDVDWDGAWPEQPTAAQKKELARLKPIVDLFWEGERDERGRPSTDYPGIKTLTEDQLASLRKAAQRAYWISIALDNKQEAFQIFERTNARGLDLEVSDLLKNYLFQTEVTGIQKKWDSIAKNADSQLVPMLRQFYFTTKGYISKADLYPKLRGVSKKARSPQDFTNALLQYSEFFAAARDLDEDAFFEWLTDLLPALRPQKRRLANCERSLRALRTFKQIQFYPVLYALCEKAVGDRSTAADKKAAALEQALRTLESFHFINNMICGRPANETERMYAGLGPTLRKKKTVVAAVEQLVDDLAGAKVPEAEFTSKFTELTYGDSLAARYYFHRAVYRDFTKSPPTWIHQESEPPASNCVFSPRKNEKRSLWELHHLMPQSRAAAHPWVHGIGNLLPTPKKTNGDLNDLLPQEQIKHAALTNLISSHPYHKAWAEDYSDDMKNGWGQAIAEQRAAAMATEAYNEIWHF